MLAKIKSATMKVDRYVKNINNIIERNEKQGYVDLVRVEIKLLSKKESVSSDEKKASWIQELFELINGKNGQDLIDEYLDFMEHQQQQQDDEVLSE